MWVFLEESTDSTIIYFVLCVSSPVFSNTQISVLWSPCRDMVARLTHVSIRDCPHHVEQEDLNEMMSSRTQRVSDRLALISYFWTWRLNPSVEVTFSKPPHAVIPGLHFGLDVYIDWVSLSLVRPDTGWQMSGL